MQYLRRRNGRKWLPTAANACCQGAKTLTFVAVLSWFHLKPVAKHNVCFICANWHYKPFKQETAPIKSVKSSCLAVS